MTILWFLLKFLLLNKFMACFEYSLLLFCGYTHTRRIYDISFRLGHKRATPWNEIMVREKAELRRGIIEREEQYYQLKIGKTAHLFLSSTVKLRKGKRTWCQEPQIDDNTSWTENQGPDDFSILSSTSVAEAASFLTKNPAWISLDYGKNPSWQLKSPKLIPKYYIYKTGRQQHNTKHQQYNVEKKTEECAWRPPHS